MKVKYLMIGVLATILPATAVMADAGDCPNVQIKSFRLTPTSIRITGKGFTEGFGVDVNTLDSKGATRAGTVTSVSSTVLEAGFTQTVGDANQEVVVTVTPPTPKRDYHIAGSFCSPKQFHARVQPGEPALVTTKCPQINIEEVVLHPTTITIPGKGFGPGYKITGTNNSFAPLQPGHPINAAVRNTESGIEGTFNTSLGHGTVGITLTPPSGSKCDKITFSTNIK